MLTSSNDAASLEFMTRETGADGALAAICPPRSSRRLWRCTVHDPRRREAEQFVRAAYWTAHRASIATLMSEFLVLSGTSGELTGVAGIRQAALERLYLERYLGRPIEEEIATVAGRSAPRAQIVEIGNFAGVSPRAARRVLEMLPRTLLDRGFRWVAFTATSPLRKLLERMGGELIPLCDANESCVAGTKDVWGTYYETRPRVLAGYLPSVESGTHYARWSIGN